MTTLNWNYTKDYLSKVSDLLTDLTGSIVEGRVTRS